MQKRNNQQPILDALVIYERRLDGVFDALESRSRGTCSHDSLMNSIHEASTAREAMQQTREEN